jgi:hypothetical protein
MKPSCARNFHTLQGGTLPMPDGLEQSIKSILRPMMPGYLLAEREGLGKTDD